MAGCDASVRPMNQIKLLHIMDKVSVDGSKIQGPARQISYRTDYYPKFFKIILCNLRAEEPTCDLLRRSNIEVISLNKSKFDPTTLQVIINLVKNINPSLLHLHGYASWTFGRIAGKFTGIPVVIQEHFIDERMPKYQKIIDFLLRRMQKKGLGVSDAVKEFMISERHIPNKDVEVIGNGVPIDRIELPSNQQIKTLKDSLSIPQNDTVIGTVGRLAEMKGQDVFLKAAKIILNKADNVTFVLVGDGPMKESLKKLSQDLGVANKVVFAGYNPNAFLYLSMFDVSVVSSVFGEGFCSVGIETFAVNTPLVITDLPCFKNVYIDHKNVLMVPSYDASSMAKAIMSLIYDKNLKTKLIRKGYDTAQHHSMQNIADQYVNMYLKLINIPSQTLV